MMNTTCFPARQTAPRRLAIALLALGIAFSFLLLAGCRKKSPDERLEEINSLFQQGNLPAGVLKAKQLIEQFPDDPASYDARMMLAGYYASTGDPQRAQEYLEDVYKALGIEDQRGGEAFGNAILLHRRQGDNEGALATVDWALSTVPHDSPTSTDLNMLRAQILLQAGREKEGVDLFRAQMRGAPMVQYRGQARELLAQYYREKNEWQKAIEVYDAWIAENPNDPIKTELDVVRSICMEKLGRKDEAHALYEESMAKLRKTAEEQLDKEKAAQRWMIVAQYYIAAGKAAEGAETLDRVRKDFAETRASIDAALMLADLSVGQRKFDDALGVLEQLQSDHPINEIAQEVQRRMKAIRQMKAKADSETTPTLKSAVPEAAAPAAAPEAKRPSGS